MSYRPRRLSLIAVLASFGALLAGISISGCSSSSSGSSGSSGTGTTSNVQAITVSTGPSAAATPPAPAINSAFTSVTVCAPGSTSQCQTIDGIAVDTGSFGLRVLASVLTISLPQQNDSSGNPIGECAEFVSSETWGPVQTADITIAGEKAGSIPIQVIGSSSFPAIPTSCSSNGTITDDLASLGANGILGVGNFVQDCGGGCTVSGSSNVGFYYTCPSSGCVVTTEALNQQVANPVFSFAKDNNGVIIELPEVTAPETSVNGSLIFGIGTQSNNGLGSATVYTVDPNTGNFTTTFNGQPTAYPGFLDTGSNAIYFLDTTTTGMPTCSVNTFWYCPSSTQNFSATNAGTNGATTTIKFSIGNGDMLVSNSSDGVAPNLGGPNSGTFDWGLPFFFGRNVYTAIEGQSTSGGTGPYVAY